MVLHKKGYFHKKRPDWNTGQHRGTPQYYAAYADWLCSHNSDELVDDLREDVPNFEAMAEKNWLGIDLFLFHRAVSFSRHTIVHRAGVPGPVRFSRLGPDEQNQIRSYMRKSIFTGVDTILPSAKDITTITEFLAALGHVLYRTASDACDME